MNNINIQQLNRKFSIEDQVSIIEGKGGFSVIQVNNSKASAQISVYAGQVLSYKPASQSEDVLFVSENAYFKQGKAIKGGIPICWPWFGAALKEGNPDHGFVRNNSWKILTIDNLENGDTKILLQFKDNEHTRELWPYSFQLTLEIVIGDSLTLELLTRNTGKEAFTITEALHTYFNVGDAGEVKVLGLEQAEYLDKTEDFIKVCQVGAITLSEETDHIYTDVKHDLLIDDPVFDRKIKISSSGNKNVVVWNPWKKASAEMADLDENDYKNFVCLEIANAATDVVDIQPNSGYWMVTNYSVV